MTTKKHGGIRQGQGRKPLTTDQPTVKVNLTMTQTQRDKLTALGGSAWVRQMIDAADVLDSR